MLVTFDLLIWATWGYLEALDSKGVIDPPLPDWFEMHRFQTKRPWTGTLQKWRDSIELACKGRGKRPKPPAPVASIIRQIEQEAVRIKPPPSWTQPGLQPTYPEIYVFQLATGIVRGLLGRAATGVAASAARPTVKETVPVLRTLAEILKPAA